MIVAEADENELDQNNAVAKQSYHRSVTVESDTESMVGGQVDAALYGNWTEPLNI